MARNVVKSVTVTSDLTGAEYTVAAESVSDFNQSLTLPVVTEDGLQMVTYRFDATDEEVIEFVTGLYSDSADTLFQSDDVTAKVKGQGANSDDDTDEARVWLKANGYTVADRGRISKKNREAYDARNA